jgi:DGQHR domain-containing protein
MTSKSLRLPALAIAQGEGRTLYQFAVDGKELDRFATVSRIRRDEESRVQGYQRTESLRHIASIRKYIESDRPMIPNGIVVAFDTRVTFTPAQTKSMVAYSQMGEINIPLDALDLGGRLPGWIVDGQQRTAAIRDAAVDEFPIPVTAFITDSQSEQREQFILVNSTKPLPKSLIYELLPGTDGLLPPALARRKISAQLLEELNRDPRSPFHWRVQTPTNPDGVIKDNSILRMLDNSIIEGYLYRFRDPNDGSGDLESMAEVVNAFWNAVEFVFPTAWNAVPRKSRLVHGAGIVSMGFLMDVMAYNLEDTGKLDINGFIGELTKIENQCFWTEGEWELAEGVLRKWNDFQNTSKDLRILSNHLLGLYRTATSR